MSAPKQFYMPKIITRRYELCYDSEKAQADGNAEERGVQYADFLTLPVGKTVKRLYFAGGILYVHLSDGLIYKYTDGALIQYAPFVYDVSPELVSITRNGECSVCIVTDDGAYFCDGTVANVVKGSCYAEYGGILLTAQGANIYFSKPFDVENSSVTENVGGIYCAMPQDGEITAMTNAGEYLAVLCKRRAIALDFLGADSDYSAERLISPIDVQVDGDSAASVGDCIVFISGGYLCMFFNRAVKPIKALPAQDFYVTGRACAFGDVYLVQVQSNGKEYTYYYDLATKKDGLISAKSIYSPSGGYAYAHGGDKIEKLTFVTQGESSFAAINDYGGTFDMNTCRKKRLKAVEAHVSGRAILTIAGESGAKVFSLKEGCNRFLVGCNSRDFTFSYSQCSQDFAVKKIALIYNISGE